MARRPAPDGRGDVGRGRGEFQEAFAEVVGGLRAYMGGLERGERDLTLRSLERIAPLLSPGD